MLWFHFLAYFFAGAFFANFVPHFVSGVLGRTFPTPFASPPFRGLSSSRVNVLYGLCNLAVAYTLLLRVGDFEPRSTLHAGAFGLGRLAFASVVISSLVVRGFFVADRLGVPISSFVYRIAHLTLLLKSRSGAILSSVGPTSRNACRRTLDQLIRWTSQAALAHIYDR